MKARVNLPPVLDELLRCDLDRAIYEADLSADDTDIDAIYMIKHWLDNKRKGR